MCFSPREQFIRKHSCFVELYNAIPKYQRGNCDNEDLQFLTEQCGTKISNSNWDKQHFIKIRGQIDNVINVRNRLTFLRLWSDPKHGSNIKHLRIWQSVHLPDIKVHFAHKLRVETLLVLKYVKKKLLIHLTCHNTLMLRNQISR